ncbi:MAG: hypothetical protein J0L82_14880 [Deltaproteobacteria bacterium]|nr:hypothetical protein [Deltaproteobacteria bacterium]
MAKVDKAVSKVDPHTGALIREVAISSAVDKSSVELSVTYDARCFVSGLFKTVRPGHYNEVCNLKAHSTARF